MNKEEAIKIFEETLKDESSHMHNCEGYGVLVDVFLRDAIIFSLNILKNKRN